MRFPPPRAGEEVKVRGRPIPFSLWPITHGATREKVQSTLFVSDPWFLIKTNISNLNNLDAKSQATAFMNQAKDFFDAAVNSDINAAKPLLLYYSFLNLGKCFVVYSNNTPLDRVVHGISEQLPTTPGAVHGSVNISLTRLTESAFALLARSLGQTLPLPIAPKTTVTVRSQDFLSQVLIGHRVFGLAENLIERFVSLESISYMHDASNNMLWMRARLFHDDLSRLDYSQTKVVSSLARSGTWRSVHCDETRGGRRLIELEQTLTIPYGQRPSEMLGDVSRRFGDAIWRSVSTLPPFRKYYIFVPSASQFIVHQLLGIYVSTFYFGSITRYKPESFAAILDSSLGPFVNEFFANQPTQFLYLMTSEFAKQEVTRAAII